MGAVIADSYWGKYKTILYLSVVYILGHAVKTVGSIPYVPSQTAHVVLSMIGLFLIAVGSGGIKPCVSAFGGDQFQPEQTYIRKQFFSLFYFAINAGSLISTFVTPIFRADVNCYPGETDPIFDECYALAFGVPGALMVVALILFVIGTRWYTMYPPEGSIVPRVCKCVYSACKNRWNTPSSERNKDHWLEYSTSSKKLIRDTKYVFRVMILFIPLPAFWALFDQQGSRWTLQAIQTNGHLGTLLIKPDQVEVLNPLFIVILIPIFESTLYPALRYFKIPFPPLRRMTVGLILAGTSFIAAAILQIEIDKTLTPLPPSNQYGVRIINAGSCNLSVTNGGQSTIVPMKSASEIDFFKFNTDTEYEYACEGITATNFFNVASPASKEEVLEFTITDGNHIETQMITHKTEDGGGRFSILNLRNDNVTATVTANDRLFFEDRPIVGLPNQRSEEIDVPYGEATVHLEYGDGTSGEYYLYLDVGGVYSVVLQEIEADSFDTLDLNPSVISVAWMVPQFVLITIGEVFLSITGLEFSYTQAPPSMKSVLTSIWLFTVSLGNIIVLIVAEAQGFEKASDEFFFFAGLIFVAAILFMFLAYRYIPVDENEFAEEILIEQEKVRKRAEEYRMKKLGMGEGVPENNYDPPATNGGVDNDACDVIVEHPNKPEDSYENQTRF
uniref:Solute carrier family 15 member 1-like n=1 Tax=Phallusia mammillata TaxID=59560 RepID=A0A6F9DSW4_9ASCI|nr:solute carrier family 15 member 1-like [Phallusia mammillata]